MELWFLSVLAATLLAGISNFAFKVASKRGYNGEIFSLYGGSLLFFLLPATWFWGGAFVGWFMVVLLIIVGSVGAINNIAKVAALRYIDTSIYFPLYKTLTPSLAIVFGVIFFHEAFSIKEWLGLLLGLLVPLVLIHIRDFSTQKNLAVGLWLVVLTGVISAVATGLNKYAINFTSGAVLQLVTIATIGVVIGSVVSLMNKYKTTRVWKEIKTQTNPSLVWWALVRSSFITASMYFMLQAFSLGAPLAIANTIQSFYFLIPIVLSVLIYKEPIGQRRIVAIALCLLTLVLFA